MLNALARQPISNDRQRFPTQQAVAALERMSPQNPMPPMQMPQGMPPGLGNSSKSIFDAYMSQAFTPQYTPPPIAGIYGMHPGGYSGFFGRQLPALPKAPLQQPIMNPEQAPWTGVGSWNSRDVIGDTGGQ
jgi:hypothetical protein